MTPLIPALTSFVRAMTPLIRVPTELVEAMTPLVPAPTALLEAQRDIVAEGLAPGQARAARCPGSPPGRRDIEPAFTPW